MNLVLTDAQGEELYDLLEVSLRELTHEIAATDNASYRVSLQDRRRRLSEVAGALGRLLALPAPATDNGAVFERELAHPGD